MASQPQSATEQTPPIELSDLELRVLSTLKEAARPLDMIEIASATLLDVDEVLKAVHGLSGKGLVGSRPPEPVRERIQIDEGALQKVAS